MSQREGGKPTGGSKEGENREREKGGIESKMATNHAPTATNIESYMLLPPSPCSLSLSPPSPFGLRVT